MLKRLLEKLFRDSGVIVPLEVEADDIEDPPEEVNHGYVVINTVLDIPGFERHRYVMGDMATTYPTLHKAMSVVANAHSEYGHNHKTARVFRLIPVPESELRDLFDRLVEVMET